jgi:hypothetical protein
MHERLVKSIIRFEEDLDETQLLVALPKEHDQPRRIGFELQSKLEPEPPTKGET